MACLQIYLVFGFSSFMMLPLLSPNLFAYFTLLLFFNIYLGGTNIRRSFCEDTEDESYCMFTALYEQSCKKNSHKCMRTCGMC